MTRDELLSLPISQLVNIILEYQLTIAQLRTRIAELESQVGAEQESRPSGEEEHVAAATSDAEDRLVPTGQVELEPRTEGEHKSVHRHRRHHRPWYKKAMRAFSPEAGISPTYLLIGVIIILIAGMVGLAMLQFR